MRLFLIAKPGAYEIVKGNEESDEIVDCHSGIVITGIILIEEAVADSDAKVFVGIFLKKDFKVSFLAVVMVGADSALVKDGEAVFRDGNIERQKVKGHMQGEGNCYLGAAVLLHAFEYIKRIHNRG